MTVPGGSAIAYLFDRKPIISPGADRIPLGYRLGIFRQRAVREQGHPRRHRTDRESGRTRSHAQESILRAGGS